MKRLIPILIVFLYQTSFAQQLSYFDSIMLHRKEYIGNHEVFKNNVYGRQMFRFFKPDSRYRINAKFILAEDTSTVTLATYSGKSKSFLLYGYANFRLRGKKNRLYFYRSRKLMTEEKYKYDLFVPFTDKTSGKESYACRYMDLDMRDIRDGMIVIDFNKCYNPYCAYGPGWNCPIPPSVNGLRIAVKAGEMDYHK